MEPGSDVVLTVVFIAIYVAVLYFLSKKPGIDSRGSVRLLISILMTVGLTAASETVLDEPYTFVVSMAFVVLFGGALSAACGIKANTSKGVGAVAGIACVAVITGFVVRGFQ